MKRSITCIICPRGCQITAEQTETGIAVSGNSCPKGESYAVQECTAPVRTVTAVVRVSNREHTMVSVKTESPVPKGEMLAVMERLHALRVTAPVALGQVILSDVCGTNILATKAVQWHKKYASMGVTAKK